MGFNQASVTAISHAILLEEIIITKDTGEYKGMKMVWVKIWVRNTC